MAAITNAFAPVAAPKHVGVGCGAVLCDLLKRVGNAVAKFFTVVALLLYDALNWGCKLLAVILTPPARQRQNATPMEPTEAIAEGLQAEPLIPQETVSTEVMSVRKVTALNRINQLKNSDVQFEFAGDVLEFDYDALLERYDSTLNPLNLLLFFDYADPGDRYAFHAKRSRFTQILRTYPLGVDNESDQRKEIRKNLSRLSVIFHEQQSRAAINPAQISALKQQIRLIVIQLIDAHDNCIDQVLSQLETIILHAIATELKPGVTTPQEQLQAQAALLLFNYKSNLIKSTCHKQNPNEPHMADLERALKQRVAPLLSLESQITSVGAAFGSVVDGLEAKLIAGTQAVNRRYNNDPTFLTESNLTDHWSDVDERPLSYLKKELESSDAFSLAAPLRSNLLAWSSIYFSFNDEDTQDIVDAASKDPNFDFVNGGPLNQAGILWLLESAGIIHSVL